MFARVSHTYLELADRKSGRLGACAGCGRYGNVWVQARRRHRGCKPDGGIHVVEKRVQARPLQF
jgi:hypothetical protein